MTTGQQGMWCKFSTCRSAPVKTSPNEFDSTIQNDGQFPSYLQNSFRDTNLGPVIPLSDNEEFGPKIFRIGENIIKILRMDGKQYLSDVHQDGHKKDIINKMDAILKDMNETNKGFAEEVKKKISSISNRPEILQWGTDQLAIELIRVLDEYNSDPVYFNLIASQFFIKAREERYANAEQIACSLEFHTIANNMRENIDNILKARGTKMDFSIQSKICQNINDLNSMDDSSFDEFKKFVADRFPETWDHVLEWKSWTLAYELIELHREGNDNLYFLNILCAQFFIKASKEERKGDSLSTITVAERIFYLLKFPKFISDIGQEFDKILKEESSLRVETNKIVNELKKIKSFKGWDDLKEYVEKEFDQKWTEYLHNLKKEELANLLNQYYEKKDEFPLFYNLLATKFFIESYDELEVSEKIIDLIKERIDFKPKERMKTFLANSESSNTKV